MYIRIRYIIYRIRRWFNMPPYYRKRYVPLTFAEYKYAYTDYLLVQKMLKGDHKNADK